MLGWFKRLFERWEPGKDYDRALALRALVSGENLENPASNGITGRDDSLEALREAVKQLPPQD